MYFAKNRRGSITVLQCYILIAFLFFTGTTVDIVRIAVAERKVQSALNTSARSMLSKYDVDLVGDYGLFGLDAKSDTKALGKVFRNYFTINLKEKNDGFSFIDYELNKAKGQKSIEGIGALVGNDKFKAQVVEYMKYKAPISIAKNIIEKFKSSGLSRKFKFANSETSLRGKRKKLNKQVKDVNSKVKEADTADKSSLSGLIDTRSKLGQALSTGNLIPQSIDEFNKQKQESDTIANTSEDGEVTVEGSEINSSGKEFENLENERTKLMGQINNNLGKLDPLITEVQQLQSQADSLQTQIDNIDPNTEDKEKQKERERLKQDLSSLQSRISNLISGLTLEKMDLITEEEDEDAKAPPETEDKKDTETFLENLKNSLSPYLKDIDPEWLLSEDDIEDTLDQDEANLEDMKMGSGGEAEAESSNGNILAYVGKFISALETLAGSGVEKLYVTEYIMDKFTYVTSKTERNHYFQKGEVEYILWGDQVQLGGIAKTMASVWVTRFAIDFIDSFATSLVAEPISRLIEALVKGFVLACKDVVSLYKGQEISICPSLKNAIKVNYEDHLRLYLLIQSIAGEKSQLLHMKQLMQVNVIQTNPEFSMLDYYTTVHAKADVSVNLWFLPLLQLDKIGIKGFEGGKYRITRETYIGY